MGHNFVSGRRTLKPKILKTFLKILDFFPALQPTPRMGVPRCILSEVFIL